MSTVQQRTHPDLRLRGPTDEELELLEGPDDDEENEGESESDPDSASSRQHSFESTSTPFRWRGKNREPSNNPDVIEGEFDDNPFDDLPASILVDILRMVLVFNGKSVHAISRLDPHYEPKEAPRNCDGDISLLHRFHVGKKSVNLSCATKPEELLAPLLVCKKWNYVGAHLFYSQNKFCFSSLGE